MSAYEAAEDLIDNNRTSEAAVVADIAVQGMVPEEIEPGLIFSVPDGRGGVTFKTTDEWDDAPRRAEARRTVTDAQSFVSYISKHGLERTEVWAHTSSSVVVGVIDAHEGANQPAGWEKHLITLKLEKTKPWLAWETADGAWFHQDDFAEFIEQRAVDVKEPDFATLIELAQKFQATKSVEFESGERRDSGQISLEYRETVKAKAGAKGDIEIPSELRIVLTPYIGGPRYEMVARFRYRIQGTSVVLGFVLERPQDVLDGAFADIVTEIRDGKTVRKDGVDAQVHQGISQPVFFGKP